MDQQQLKKAPQSHTCKFGLLIPVVGTQTPTHYSLRDPITKQHIGHKLRCTHGIVAEHCRHHICIGKYEIRSNKKGAQVYR